MARYLNVIEKKTLVVRNVCPTEHSPWISKHDYMVSIEADNGRLCVLPFPFLDYLEDMTADEFLREWDEDKAEILFPIDWKIKEGITDWIINSAVCYSSSMVEAICYVVSLLTSFGMWKEEYSRNIDFEKLTRELK